MKKLGMENGDFSVNVKNEEVVTALFPIQEHRLPLSNLDLLLPKVDVGVFFCYKNPMLLFTSITTTFESMVVSLKKALAQALVSYYPFGGEVVSNFVGEPEILCNNRGVDFVEAVADVELQCLNFYNPRESIEGKFVPKKKHGVLSVQATSLKCGGIVVACTFDHRVADAYSTNMFLVSWAEIAQLTKPIKPTTTNTPCFNRSLLSPRHMGSIHSSIHDIYIPISKLPPPSTTTTKPFCSRIYHITLEELHRLQSLATSTNNDNTKPTKLESFSAYLWKLVARATIKDVSRKKAINVKMGIVVDGRKRLMNINCGEEEREEIMTRYFGNVLSIPFCEKSVEELVDKPLRWVVDEVCDFVSIATTKEHCLGLIDWVEANRPVPGMAKIYCCGNNEGPGFVVSSGQRFPEDKVDFGWGKVVFASYYFPSYYFPWGGEAGYVMPMPSPLRKGDWVVYMHLLKEHLEFIELEANRVFKPLTWDYLNQ